MSSHTITHPNFYIDQEIDKVVSKNFETLVNNRMSKLPDEMPEEEKRSVATEELFVQKEACKLKKKKMLAAVKKTATKTKNSGKIQNLRKLAVLNFAAQKTDRTKTQKKAAKMLEVLYG